MVEQSLLLSPFSNGYEFGLDILHALEPYSLRSLMHLNVPLMPLNVSLDVGVTASEGAFYGVEGGRQKQMVPRAQKFRIADTVKRLFFFLN